MNFRRTRDHIPQQRAARKDEALSEGEKAHVKAIADLAAVEARGAEVRRVATSLRELRRKNHLSSKIEQLFYGGTA